MSSSQSCPKSKSKIGNFLDASKHLFKRACPSVGHDGDDDFFVVLLYLHVLMTMTIVVTVMNSINVRPLILLF